MAYKRIGAAVRYAGTRGISLCFIAAIKETLSRLCQGEQLDGKGKNDLVVSVPFRNPFEHAHPCYNPPTRRRYRVDDTIRRYILVPQRIFFFLLFFFLSRVYLIVICRVYCWKILASLLINNDKCDDRRAEFKNNTSIALHFSFFLSFLGDTLLRCEKNFVVNENTLEQYTIILGTSRDVARDRIYISQKQRLYRVA